MASFETINTDLDKLPNNATQGKAILTFANRTGNNSNSSITPAIDKLENDTNKININSFTIGLNGDIAFHTDITKLEKVFESFSKSISNVYHLT